jgi:hypothetical protein
VDLPIFWQNLTFSHCSNCNILNFHRSQTTILYNSDFLSEYTACTQLLLIGTRDKAPSHGSMYPLQCITAPLCGQSTKLLTVLCIRAILNGLQETVSGDYKTKARTEDNSIRSMPRLYGESHQGNLLAAMRVVDQLPTAKYMSMDDKEYALLGAVTRQWLVKIQKTFVCCSTVIFRICRSMKLL